MADYGFSRAYIAQDKRTLIGPGAEVPLGSRSSVQKSLAVNVLSGDGSEFNITHGQQRASKNSRVGPGAEVPTGRRMDSYQTQSMGTKEARLDSHVKSSSSLTPRFVRLLAEVPLGTRGEVYFSFALTDYYTGLYVVGRRGPGQTLRTRLGPGAEIPRGFASDDYTDQMIPTQLSVVHRDAEAGFPNMSPNVAAQPPTTYLMGGWISTVPVVPWTSSNPNTADEYPGGPPYPSPFYVIGPLPT